MTRAVFLSVPILALLLAGAAQAQPAAPIQAAETAEPVAPLTDTSASLDFRIALSSMTDTRPSGVKRNPACRSNEWVSLIRPRATSF